jgi:hypothetical protein
MNTKYIRQMTMTSTEKFLDDYNELHKYCPDCGEEHYTTTLAGGSVDLSDTESYKDSNTCYCKCGSVHIRHDRVKEVR